MTIQAKRAPGSAIAGDSMGVETLRSKRPDRQKRIAAANAVLAAIPDIQARREVLAALFGNGEAWRKRAANARRRARKAA